MIADPTNIEPIPGFGEPLSSMSHLVAAGVFLALSWYLVRRGRGNLARVTALSLFAFACVFQLAISGVYHLLTPGSTGNQVLLRIDHAAIFLLIAATFTPVHIILFRGFWRWGTLTLIWGAAITGIVLKTVFSAHTPIWLGATLYLAFGWVGLFSGTSLWRRHGFRMILPLFCGGLAYSLGLGIEAVTAAMGVFQLVPGVVGGHEVFHFAVLVGMGLHWRFMHCYSDGHLPPAKLLTSAPL